MEQFCLDLYHPHLSLLSWVENSTTIGAMSFQSYSRKPSPVWWQSTMGLRRTAEHGGSLTGRVLDHARKRRRIPVAPCRKSAQSQDTIVLHSFLVNSVAPWSPKCTCFEETRHQLSGLLLGAKPSFIQFNWMCRHFKSWCQSQVNKFLRCVKMLMRPYELREVSGIRVHDLHGYQSVCGLDSELERVLDQKRIR